MIPPSPNPVVHLELHTGNLARAFGFYSRVCGWRMERVDAAGRSYQMLDWEGRFDGGIVESGTDRPLWLPYVEVDHIGQATERAKRSGARVLLERARARPGGEAWWRRPRGGDRLLAGQGHGRPPLSALRLWRERVRPITI
jgi:predicted enzyme related to lactoylglutathione lyase